MFMQNLLFCGIAVVLKLNNLKHTPIYDPGQIFFELIAVKLFFSQKIPMIDV